MKYYIPNIITSLNLLCGCVSILLVFNNNLLVAAFLILIAMLLDYLDGFIARLSDATTRFGMQLDSFADLVSFGMAPGFLMFMVLKNSNMNLWEDYNFIFPYIALLIPLFTAFRLALFNISQDKEGDFNGLPSPANAFFYASLVICFHYQDSTYFHNLLSSPLFLLPAILVTSFIMISNISMFSLKFKNYKMKSNKTQYAFIIASLGIIIAFRLSALPLIIPLYIVFSILNNTLVNEEKEKKTKIQ